jgi:hypothetical protein
MARQSKHFVVLASILGSFVVYGAHLACGPGSTGVPPGFAQSPGIASASASGASTVATTAPTTTTTAGSTGAPAGATGCGCGAGTTTASFAVSGDEKIVLDPLDASADLTVAYRRAAGGKKVAEVTAVVRAYRTDQPSEHPTTVAIRVIVPENGGSPGPKDVEAYVTTYGAKADVPPRAFATVTKNALTVTMNEGALEMKGSLTLKDVPTGKSVTIDKLAVRKVGSSLLPVRNGAFKLP